MHTFPLNIGYSAQLLKGIIKLNCDMKPMQLNGITKNTDSPESIVESYKRAHWKKCYTTTAKFPSNFSSVFSLKSYN